MTLALSVAAPHEVTYQRVLTHRGAAEANMTGENCISEHWNSTTPPLEHSPLGSYREWVEEALAVGIVATFNGRPTALKGKFGF